jgi:hypothetical protein
VFDGSISGHLRGWLRAGISNHSQLLSMTPAQGAVNVAVNTAVTAIFSEAMATSSIAASTFMVTSRGRTVAGAVTYSGMTATFFKHLCCTEQSIIAAIRVAILEDGTLIVSLHRA